MSGTIMLSAAGAIAALMVLTWVVSLIRKDASIVDIVWGFGFVVVAWVSAWASGGTVNDVVETDAAVVGTTTDWTTRGGLLTILTTIWGLRLAGYLAWRNLGKGEDYRYRAMRKRWGARFPVVSLVTVFGMQGVLMWIVSLPVQLGQRDAGPDLGALAWIGLAIWLVGFCFESIGDLQLARFKANPANAGKVMDQGLWRYTRHPNYFGDACVWWGLAVIAAETDTGRWGVIGAVVMTILLRRVSGVTLLEKSLTKRREGYVDYVRRTSPFFPRPPKP